MAGGAYSNIPPSLAINGFRSGLELANAEDFEARHIGFRYEPGALPYVQERTYRPDFCLAKDRGLVFFPGREDWWRDYVFLHHHFFVETKGRFKPEDRRKHLDIRDQHPDVDIRFVFSNSRKLIAKGAKMTLAQWCEKHGLLYADRLVPDEWFST